MSNERIVKLRELLRTARVAYYKGEPTLLDNEYDALENELKNLSPNDEFFEEIGTTDTSEEIEHIIPMRSLDKRHTGQEVVDWARKNPKCSYVVMPKMDGFAIGNRYNSVGEYILSVVRGKGFKGDNATKVINPNTVPTIKKQLGPRSIISKLSDGKTIEVRGELIILKKDLIEINSIREKKGQPLFANCRNAAASACHVKNPQDVIDRRLKFMAYNIVTF